MLTLVRELDRFDEGYSKGYDKGFAAGYAEGVTKVVLNMMCDCVPIETISKYSELSIEEINNIKEKHLNSQL